MDYLDDEVLQVLLARITDLMEAGNDRNDGAIKAIVGNKIVPYMVSQGMCDLIVEFPQGGGMELTIRNHRAEMALLIPGQTKGDH